jgi:hypothetical protein
MELLQPIKKRSSNLLSNGKAPNGAQKYSKENCEQFEYKRILYKCINGGVVRVKQDKTRCTQSNNISYEFPIHLNFKRKKNVTNVPHHIAITTMQ